MQSIASLYASTKGKREASKAGMKPKGETGELTKVTARTQVKKGMEIVVYTDGALREMDGVW